MIADLFDRLAAPFPADAISWRVGSTNIDRATKKPREGQEARGLALAYLDARDVMDRLDLVCGPEGWQCRYSHVGPTTVCDIGVWSVTMQDWLWKADGAGATDVEAEKGMLSDSFKRSAVRWGIGRYLYGLPSPWVKLKQAGQTWVIADDEYGKLRTLLTTHGAPKNAATAKRDKDFEFFKDKIDSASSMEELGSIGREIKDALPMLPAAHRDPLHDAYALKREELMAA